MTDSEDVVTPAHLAGSTYTDAVRQKSAQLKSLLIQQTLDDIESWGKAVDTQWQYAHPGQTQMSPTTEAEYNKYVSTVKNDYYDWVIPAFERYLQPDPDATNAMIDALGKIESSFQGSTDNAGGFNPTSPALSRITDALIDMGHWTGQFQENFVDNFLSPLQNVSHNEGTLAQVARELLLINKVHYIRYRDSVIKLLDKSITAVKTLNNQRDPGPVKWGSVVAIAVGTILTVTPVGPFVIAAGATAIIGGTVGSALIPEPPEKVDLAAPTAQEVAVNITDAMSTLDTDTYNTCDQPVAKAIRDLYDAVSSVRSHGVSSNTTGSLNVARPELSGAKSSDILNGSFVPED